MKSRTQPIIVYCTIIAFAILYEHQPLLPLLGDHWGRPISDIALLTTVTLFPLAMAPLLYGYILERFSSHKMLVIGFSILFISQAILSTAPDYALFLSLRAIEGLMLPAIFTSLMTYTSSLGDKALARRNLSIYIASTIAGGFMGRTVTGLVTELSDWQSAFWMWSGLALIAVISLFGLDSDPRNQLQRIQLHEILALLKRPVIRMGLFTAFLLFFVFAAMLNFLPFRMRELHPDIGTGAIAMVYTGYLIGIVISLGSPRLIRRHGGESRVLMGGAFIYLLGTLSFLIPRLQALYVAMFIFAAGMFALHSVLSGYMNHLSERKGLISGLYISAYYTGGALGSFLPGLFYHSTGWSGFVVLLMAMVLLLLGMVWRMSVAEEQVQPA
ncbi:MFS transporter [endosymbiont of unidentified scaly snail isolate Monju]|uniref:MFS transporter n=1 Tax=endosymbiont of unidentified scaly snail isolate Monju TaxID=1248727 RepID=UPI0003892A9E|nr:MFS transporter [endosymbiont of unidentified scaly snail isolate Monju]BAN68933.1 major facilitator transporter [endosymbiont of unidentified scaly snail isolate Monju]